MEKNFVNLINEEAVVGASDRNFDSYEEFCEVVRAKLEEITGSVVSLSSVMKNNDVVFKGLTIRGEEAISPTIYLEKYYERFTEGLMTFEEICDDIVRFYDEHKCPDFDFDVKDYSSWNAIKNRIKMRLVNRKRNAEYLKQLPHLIFGDLAIIFVVELDKGTNDFAASIKIRNEHMKDLWNVTVNDLYEAAKTNKDETVVKSMLSVIAEMRGVPEELLFNFEQPADAPEMFVASTEDKNNGAVVLLNEVDLKEFATEHGSFYIIPSSIHELIFLTLNGCRQDSDEISDMIQSINDEVVNPEEVLGDHAYYYDADTDTLYSEYGGEEMIIETIETAA